MEQAAAERLDALTISRLWNPTATTPLERSSSLLLTSILTFHCVLRSSNIRTSYSSCLEEGVPRSMSLALAMAPAPVTLPTNSNGTSNKPNHDPSHCPPRSLSLPPSPCRIRATFPPKCPSRIRRASRRPTGPFPSLLLSTSRQV